MSALYSWYSKRSKRFRDSISISFSIVGVILSTLSTFNIALMSFQKLNTECKLILIAVIYSITFWLTYLTIGLLFRKSINLIIRKTPVSISCGDIFKTPGLKVIGCDTHFHTEIDDTVISSKSLHGQLVLNHGNKESIESLVEKEAKKLNLEKDVNGLYSFPLGTIIRYSNSKGETFLMLAMTELDNELKAHTNMAKFELMLMRMWKEIDRLYAQNDVVLPILGTGITRFDDGPKDNDAILRCMLCTLNSSGVTLKSTVKVMLYGDINDIPLYEYKGMFHVIPS